MQNKTKKFLATTFTLSGTIIGAGILGLPYVFSRAGFFVGLFWLLILGMIMIFINLAMGEVTLRTKSIHQLPGYAGKYLGNKGKWVMFLSILFGVYSALLAYLIGEGQSISRLFFGNIEYSLLFGVAFWMVMTLLLRGGLSRLKDIELWSVLGIILALVTIFAFLLPDVNSSNLYHLDSGLFFVPFGVVLFALLGFNSIPELRREVGEDKKMLKGAIILGVLIPIVLYLMFSFVFVGVLGQNISEVATLAFGGIFGKILLLLGILTMMTSFFVLSFALKDYFVFDLRKKKLASFYVSFVPLVLYLLVSFFDLGGFVMILGIGGVVSGGITGTLILIMNLVSKKKGDIVPAYKVPIGWPIIILLGIVFLAGILFEVFY